MFAPVLVIPNPTTMLAISLASLGITFILWRMFHPQLKFIWHCFFRPLGTDNQKARLDKVCFHRPFFILI